MNEKAGWHPTGRILIDHGNGGELYRVNVEEADRRDGVVWTCRGFFHTRWGARRAARRIYKAIADGTYYGELLP